MCDQAFIKKKKKQLEKEKSLKRLIAMLCIAFAVWFGWLIWAATRYGSVESAGQFGDTFGALNALFTAFAFAGVLYTIHLQRTELALQRKEMKRARKQAKRSADAQTYTEEVMRLQVECTICSLRVDWGRIEIENLVTTIKARNPHHQDTKSLNARDNKTIRDLIDKMQDIIGDMHHNYNQYAEKKDAANKLTTPSTSLTPPPDPADTEAP